MTTEQKDLSLALVAPFPPSDVKWLPRVVKGNQAMAVAYLDVKSVLHRLDCVFGVGGWQDQYELLPDGCVKCRLSVKIDGEWIVREDAGGPSKQPDPADRMKAAFSNALKRAAVKLGIGRYLARLPRTWADYDAQKRQFTRTPALPAWAMPAPNGTKS